MSARRNVHEHLDDIGDRPDTAYVPVFHQRRSPEPPTAVLAGRDARWSNSDESVEAEVLSPHPLRLRPMERSVGRAKYLDHRSSHLALRLLVLAYWS